jgi:hypothetical protein
MDGNLVVRVTACAAPEQGDLCAARAWPTSLTGALGREADEQLVSPEERPWFLETFC